MIRVKKCETTGFEPGKSCPGFLYVTLHCWPWGRILATLLNCLIPDITERVKREQHRQISGHNAKAQERKLDRGDRVFVKSFSSTNPATWLSDVVMDIHGPVS